MFLTPDVVEAAAQILATRRLHGLTGPRLPEACRPLDIESALAIQAAVSRQLDAQVGGYKCGLPAGERWIIAPIYRHTIQRQNPCMLWPRNGKAAVEPELAFVMARDLPPRELPYTPHEVDAAIGSTHLALELIGGRYAEGEEVSFTEKLADGLVNQGLFLGPAVDSAKAAEASEIHLRLADPCGELSRHAGLHPNAQPKAPLYWLAEFLRSRGEGLLAGQVVITGSYAGLMQLPLHEMLSLHFDGLGCLEVCLQARKANGHASPA